MLTWLKTVIYGRLRTFEARVLAIVLLYAIFGASAIGLASLFFELYKGIYKQTLPLALGLTGIYLVLRFVKQAQRYTVALGFLSVLLCHAFLALLWPVSQGSFGNTPLFFLILIFYQMLLFQGWFLLLNIALSLAFALGLIAYESLHPEWLVPPPASVNPLQHAIETAFSLCVAAMMTYVIGGSYKRGWSRLITQRERRSKEFEEDLILSRNLQKQIYKYSKDVVKDFDFYAYMHPSSEIGGDLFELSSPQEGCLRVFLADAQGHGINAALSSVLIKGEWARLKDRKMNPATLLSKLNQAIIDSFGDSIAFTALVADIYQDRILFSSAGHPIQYLASADQILPLENSGPPAGMFEFNRYKQQEYKFNKDARVLFFTDALIEEGGTYHDETSKSVEWLENAIQAPAKSSKEFTERLLKGFARRLGQEHKKLNLNDDLLLLVIGHAK